jgi:hypothetical protein
MIGHDSVGSGPRGITLSLLLAVLLVSGCATRPEPLPSPKGNSSSAGPKVSPVDPVIADEYTNDLRTICHVHELAGKSPDEGFGAVAWWLTDHIHTNEARKRLSEMPHVDLIDWMQRLRRDAAARGISPCPFADTWEAFHKGLRADGGA